jgi:hypothetical protein
MWNAELKILRVRSEGGDMRRLEVEKLGRWEWVKDYGAFG